MGTHKIIYNDGIDSLSVRKSLLGGIILEQRVAKSKTEVYLAKKDYEKLTKIVKGFDL